MKICIGIPTNRQFRPQTVQALTRMVAFSAKKHELFIIVPTEGYNTAENRNYTVAQAIKNGCDYILFSDDDMSYPEDSLDRLLSHDKDAIGVLYSVRRRPPALVIEYDGTDEQALEETEIFKCKAIGTGLLLVKTSVFSKIKSPFFGYQWHENGMVKVSTDWFMCEKLQDAGIEIWADPMIKDVKHHGDYAYETH